MHIERFLFDMAIGETFLAERKIGDKGRAFKLTKPKRKARKNRELSSCKISTDDDDERNNVGLWDDIFF